MTHSRTISFAASALLLGGLVYLILELTVANAWVSPAYDWANNFVPDLGNSARGLYLGRMVNSPLYSLMNAGFIFQGVFFGSAAILLSRILKGRTRTAMLVFGLLHAVGLIMVAYFHQAPGAANGGTLILNIAGAGLAILAGNFIVIVAGSQWKRLSLPSWFGWLSIALGSISIILGFLLFGNNSVPPGIRERASIYSFIFWQIIAGTMLIYSRQTKKSNKDAQPVASASIAFETTEVILPGIVEPGGLLTKDRTLSGPAAGEVIIKVEATGISFAEKAMRRGQYPGMPKFPFVPGYDLTGTVVAVGADVDTSLIGKRFAVLTLHGGWATYATVAAQDLLPIPEAIDPAGAETLIVNGITAWQMLYHNAKIKQGDTILVHGANGGVGTILTQLAQIAGVRVIGASSPKHHEALSKQGIIPVDYNDKSLANTIRNIAPEGVDAVFDNIGGKSINVSFSVLKKGGTMVGYAMMSKIENGTIRMIQFILLLLKVMILNILPNGRNAAFYYIWSGKGTEKFRNKMREDYRGLMELLSKRVLKPQIAAVFPLAQIAKAMEFAESGTVYGKVVLLP